MTGNDDLHKELEQQYQHQLDSLRAELQEVIPKVDGDGEIDKFLAQPDMDDRLAHFVILKEATPKGLAAFAAEPSCNDQGVSNQELIEKLFANPTLMKEMLLADGAKGGQYGRAMQIYTEIQGERQQEQCPATDGRPWDLSKRDAPVLDRLAMAVALEHAVPMRQENPVADASTGNKVVDPVQRYLNYELAFLQGELDPNFCGLSTWLLRMVVDGEEPDECAAWGRRMLRTFRPDLVLLGDDAWRYVNLVRTEVRYGSKDVKYDRDELHRYQNILMNGGICGKGHGALAHWTQSHGWVVCLGPGWGNGWTKGVYGQDVDFHASCQARDHPEEYWRVKHAQWIGDVMGEARVYGATQSAKCICGIWYSASLRSQKAILDDKKKKPVRMLDLPKNYKPTIAQEVEAASPPRDAKKVVYDNDGNDIRIPAAGFEGGTKQSDVKVMTSFKGGFQMYLSSFQAKGLTVLRGGTWKSTATEGCSSGFRLKSGGYGRYNNWGFRVALSPGHCHAKPDENGCYSKELTIPLLDESKTSMELVYIEPGKFIMGGERDKDGKFECVEVPKHPVEITEGYYIGKYPVTQAQYTAIVRKNPSGSTKDPNCPVDNIAEDDARQFCRNFAEITTYCIRLPTEAEWEYAARAGSDTTWFFGDDPSSLGEYAWFKDNSNGKSHPVGQKKPNAFGLYDVYGNVVERVNDKYEINYYKKSPETDPQGPQPGTSSQFKYKIKVPTAGEYSLSAEVCTVNYNQNLTVSVNGSDGTAIAMPFTCGDWLATDPVTLLLQEGENTLEFWREDPPQYGAAVTEFRLTKSTQCLATE